MQGDIDPHHLPAVARNPDGEVGALALPRLLDSPFELFLGFRPIPPPDGLPQGLANHILTLQPLGFKRGLIDFQEHSVGR